MNDIEVAIIVALKNAEHYVTRSDLERICACPSDVIVSTIEELIGRGYRIEEIPGEGYRLLDTPHLLDGTDLKTLLGTDVIGSEILTFGRVTSTNDVAVELARSGAREGTVVVAEEQTRGRGRLGRTWYSPPRCGLWFSIVLKPPLSGADIVTVSLAVALGVVEVLRDRYGVRAELKWPNDVVVNSKKICGILAEGDFVIRQVQFVIVGVGVNVLNDEQDFPAEIRTIATSLKLETGETPPRSKVLADLLEGIERRYLILCDRGFAAIRDEMVGLSSLMGKLVRVTTVKDEIVGVVQDIDEAGRLVIRKENGAHERILAGDVRRLL